MRIACLVLAAAVAAWAVPASAAGNAANGQRLFTIRCAICHSAPQGGPNKIGPNLFGIVGRKAGALPGYSYSQAMKNSPVVWNQATLRAYLTSPARNVPGGKMAFAGIPNATEMDDMLAYLASLK